LPGLDGLPVPYIADENPRKQYAHIAAKLFAGQPETIVALTGTNGKSSTIEFLRQIWSYAGKNAACFGTLGVTTNEGVTPLKHTTPDAVALHQTLKDLSQTGITHAGMEASSHGLVQYRLDVSGLNVMTVGWSGGDIRIDEVTPRSASQTVELVWDKKRHKVELPLAGEFQTLNAVSALGLAVVTGVAADVALKALTRLQTVAGRMEKAGEAANGAPVFIDFAHTPDGLEKLLRGVRPHTMGRIVVVFGCGGDRDPDKRPKMGAIAAKLADHVIVTDDNPRTEKPKDIRAAVMKGCPDADEIGDRAEAIATAISMLKSNDCLVIAGKGHESGQIVGKEIIPFNDVVEARKALAAAA